MYSKEKNEYDFSILNSYEKWIKSLLWWDGLKGKYKWISATEMTSLLQIANRVYLIKDCIKSIGFSNCLFSSSKRQVIALKTIFLFNNFLKLIVLWAKNEQ